jgi:hypothetical protein
MTSASINGIAAAPVRPALVRPVPVSARARKRPRIVARTFAIIVDTTPFHPIGLGPVDPEPNDPEPHLGCAIRRPNR